LVGAMLLVVALVSLDDATRETSDNERGAGARSSPDGRKAAAAESSVPPPTDPPKPPPRDTAQPPPLEFEDAGNPATLAPSENAPSQTAGPSSDATTARIRRRGPHNIVYADQLRQIARSRGHDGGLAPDEMSGEDWRKRFLDLKRLRKPSEP
jgi:hypothetical protein